MFRHLYNYTRKKTSELTFGTDVWNDSCDKRCDASYDAAAVVLKLVHHFLLKQLDQYECE
jgi:hypothetical protein